MSADASMIRVSDLAVLLSGNQTLAELQHKADFVEKLVFGLIIADVILFLLLILAICSVCKPCEDLLHRWGYARDSVPVASAGINAHAKMPISMPGRCGLQA